VFRRRVGAILNGGNVGFERSERRSMVFLKIAHKPRRASLGDVQHVVQDEYLAIGARTRADTDDRHVQLARDRLAQFVRHALEQHDVGTGILESRRGGNHRLRLRAVAPLHLEAADLVHGLRLEPEVCADRDIVTREMLDDLELPVAALVLVIALVGPYVATQRRVGDVNVAKRARWQWDGQAVGRMFGTAFVAERPLWAVTAAGCLPYFSGLPALDMLGLNDAHIARQPPDPSMPLAHDHGDGRYVLDRAPDLVTFGLPRGTRPAFKSGREMKDDPRFARDYQRVTFRALTPISVLTDSYVRKRGKIGFSGSLLDAADGPVVGELVVPAYLLQKALGHPLADGSLGARIDPRTRATIELPELPSGRYRARLRPENARVDIVVRSRTGATLEQAADDVFEVRVPSVLRLELRAPHLSTLVGAIVLERLGPAVPGEGEGEGRAAIAVQLAAPIATTPPRHLNPHASTAAAGQQTFEPFTVSDDAWLCFNISGGRAESYESQVGVRLIDLSAEAPTTRMVFTGKNDDRPREVCADLAPLSGRSIRIEAFDESPSAHVSADGFVLHQP